MRAGYGMRPNLLSAQGCISSKTPDGNPSGHPFHVFRVEGTEALDAPQGLPERLPQRQRPPPFPSRASQQARGMEFARQSQFSPAARPETSQVLASRHPGDYH